MSEIDKKVLAAHWSQSRCLLWTVLGIWFFFAYFIPLFINQQNEIVIMGFPLGYYMAAQGSPLAFVLLIFWFAKKQNAIDEHHGLAEDEEGAC